MHVFTRTLKKSGLIFLLLAGMTSASFAQVRTITGTISAGDTKETLPGATVQIKGTTIGVVTDIDGKYSIAVKSPEEILVFSFLGYTPVEERVGDRSVIDISLYSHACFTGGGCCDRLRNRKKERSHRRCEYDQIRRHHQDYRP